MRRLFLSIAICTVCTAPAHADVNGDVGQHLGQLGTQLGHVGNKIDQNVTALLGFLGWSAPETGFAALEVTPAIRIARSVEVMPTDAPDFLPANIRLPATALMAELPTPKAEKGKKFLYCVEYARSLSGLNIFGDARHWWARAKGLYERTAKPTANAVMVFTGTSKLKRGHVAVVSHVVSSREIRVEQANWLNRGEINYSTPIIDVSEKNDWSKVRVWHTPTGTFGSAYAVSGFILQPVQRLDRAN